MKEAHGDLWQYEATFRCITTNGFVKRNGQAVMGRGCAREAAQKWPDLPMVLGGLLEDHGNHVHELGYSITIGKQQERNAWDVISFPVKHHWKQAADLELIERSAHELVELIDSKRDNYNFDIVIPRPGCGNGQRDWETEVKPILEPILDNRFVVITF